MSKNIQKIVYIGANKVMGLEGLSPPRIAIPLLQKTLMI
jgi:hypothetical protein